MAAKIRPAASLLAAADFTIAAIGSAGDGVSHPEADQSVHIARTLPGESVRARRSADGKRADLLDVLTASLRRVTPPCPHFTEGCGGCALQHWADAEYADWKRGLVVSALERAGFADPPVGALVRTPPHARRRMDFAVARVDGGVRLGLHVAHGRGIVDLSVCPILHPALEALQAPLRQLLRGLSALRHAGSVLANLLEDGADLLVRTDGPLAATDRVKLSAFASAHAIRRIAWASPAGPAETASMLAAPFVVFAGHRVELPPGAFLQASAEGEAAIVGAVLASVPGRLTRSSRAVELFAGCGTISFPLATRLRVQAFEGEAETAGAVRRAQAGSRVEMTQRDLARQPLSTRELAGAAMVVLDPPYAGAQAQMQAIAASNVPLVSYVSCNPGALARDAVVLARGGYRLASVLPIDQFLWSAQVECVATFAK